MEGLRLWRIGWGGTELYAALSEEDVRRHYMEQVGEGQAEEDFAGGFEEVTGEALATPFEYNDGGVKVTTTWRQVLDGLTAAPAQVSSGY